MLQQWSQLPVWEGLAPCILLSKLTKGPAPSVDSACSFCRKRSCDTTCLLTRSLMGVSRREGLKEDGVGKCFARDTLALFDNGFARLSASSFITSGWKVSSVSSSSSSALSICWASPEGLTTKQQSGTHLGLWPVAVLVSTSGIEDLIWVVALTFCLSSTSSTDTWSQ